MNRKLNISDFTYDLPADRIAQFPLKPRHNSRLLVYKDGIIKEDRFLNLSGYLPANCRLLLNDSKVIHARLPFRNATGAFIEVFLLNPILPVNDFQLAMFSHEPCTWQCLVGNASKWREQTLILPFTWQNETGVLKVTKAGMAGDDFLIKFQWQPDHFSFARVLQAAGKVPLPPYIRRNSMDEDEEAYQTVYAVQDGSVAAPTAGLHFTDTVFEKLRQKGISLSFATLHVGAGTFLPVKSDLISDHTMHEEQMVITRHLVRQLLESKNEPLVCVGTTSLRFAESLYWLGLRILNGQTDLNIDQWEPYSNQTANPGVEESLQAIQDYMNDKKLNQLIASSKLLILPGYEFKLTSGLITNFHLPKSTLLLLIAALAGDDWKKIYQYALEKNFRFLSYGDGSLLWRIQNMKLPPYSGF